MVVLCRELTFRVLHRTAFGKRIISVFANSSLVNGTDSNH